MSVKCRNNNNNKHNNNYDNPLTSRRTDGGITQMVNIGIFRNIDLSLPPYLFLIFFIDYVLS